MSKKPSNYDQIQQLVNKANGIKEEPKVTPPPKEQEVEEVIFDYHETAYLPVFNKETKKYDMYLIRVNTDTQQAVVEVEPRSYDTKMRAHLEVCRILNDQFVKNKEK